jgi:hypothetical protein
MVQLFLGYPMIQVMPMFVTSGEFDSLKLSLGVVLLFQFSLLLGLCTHHFTLLR